MVYLRPMQRTVHLSDVRSDDPKRLAPRRMELYTGSQERRRWPDETKARIVLESLEPGACRSFDGAAPSCHKVDANRCGIGKIQSFRFSAKAGNWDSDKFCMGAIAREANIATRAPHFRADPLLRTLFCRRSASGLRSECAAQEGRDQGDDDVYPYPNINGARRSARRSSGVTLAGAPAPCDGLHAAHASVFKIDQP